MHIFYYYIWILVSYFLHIIRDDLYQIPGSNASDTSPIRIGHGKRNMSGDASGCVYMTKREQPLCMQRQPFRDSNRNRTARVNLISATVAVAAAAADLGRASTAEAERATKHQRRRRWKLWWGWRTPGRDAVGSRLSKTVCASATAADTSPRSRFHPSILSWTWWRAVRACLVGTTVTRTDSGASPMYGTPVNVSNFFLCSHHENNKLIVLCTRVPTRTRARSSCQLVCVVLGLNGEVDLRAALYCL